MLRATIQLGNIHEAIAEICHRIDHPGDGIFKRAKHAGFQEKHVGLADQAGSALHYFQIETFRVNLYHVWDGQTVFGKKGVQGLDSSHRLRSHAGLRLIVPGKKTAAVVASRNKERQHARVVCHTGVNPANLVPRVDEVLDADLQVILGLEEHVLRLRKVLEGRTRPIAVVGSHVQHKAGGEAEAFQSGKEHTCAVVRPAIIA